ncbi:acyltransferase ChoActase/COT/CPT [Fimicolochytrium jonesii]|uniref:acyltransferase ChoActase/COT/CPT n=1 Tax=Fimicolochytrium jonesii TaxID=1396493 RepID=UPI0022FE8916|nr:acyltransferase ChoActase/COT/CPT [Fimicolochytrium jonesii]KAI8824167.1 acyltransferase ChoActase/COT/CPT [Fimicolochytrium jonesii]
MLFAHRALAASALSRPLTLKPVTRIATFGSHLASVVPRHQSSFHTGPVLTFSASTAHKMHSLTPSGPNKPLFAQQQSLPKLPVAPLQETAAKYLKSLKPLLNEQQYAHSEAVVKDFIKPGGEGEKLHKRLQERAATEKTSWLYEWWNDWAYMAYRDPVVINVSYYFVFKDELRKQWREPASRAASIVTGALEFKRLVVEEELQPETAKGGALSMDQFQWLFNACRVPTIPSDTTFVADPRKTSHVVVIRKNKFYSIETRLSDGRQLSTAEIEHQIRAVYQDAGETVGPAVGILTSENRDVWTKAREELLQSPVSRASLEAIQSADLVLCLDDSAPVTREEASRACWHGDGRNRFFDKPLQFIIFDNGKAGFLGEHSMMDATPTSMLCDFICTGLAKDKIAHGSTSVASNLPAPRPLPFEVTPSIQSRIEIASAHFDTLIGQHDLRVQAFHDYGKNLIKKFKVSPDAYAQMAIQLAYYKKYGVCRPTYESAQTRKFAFGRTETCRSTSTESVAWVKAMQDPSVPAARKYELAQAALNAHTRYMNDAVENKGVDRLLLGLKLSLRPDEPVPAIFKDPAFDYSKTWFLSTSQISSEYYDGYGWGEVIPNGYGVPYSIMNDSMRFTFTCRKELRADHMVHHIGEALREMRVVFESAIPPAVPKAKL